MALRLTIMKNYKSFNHLLIREDRCDFDEIRCWLQENAKGEWKIDKYIIPKVDRYASIYLERFGDAILFRLRWETEE